MSYVEEKNRSAAYASPISPNNPISATSQTSGSESLADYEKKDLTYKRRIRTLRFVSRVVSLILAAFMIGMLAFALAKYFLTRNHLISGNVHPWVTPATLWPTIMLLSISVVTFFLDLFMLCAYVCGVEAANKVSTVTSVVGYIMLAVRVVVWGVSAGLFRMAKNGKDLWGYSCSPYTDTIQTQVQSFLDFGKLCTMQQGAWYASIIETIAYLLTFIITIFVMRRAIHKKKLAKIRESMAMEAGYNQNFEMGTTYKPGDGKSYMPVTQNI